MHGLGCTTPPAEGGALVGLRLQNAVEEVACETNTPEGDSDRQEEGALVLKDGRAVRVRVGDVRGPR